MERIIQETIYKHRKDKRVGRNCQYGNWGVFLTDQKYFCNEMTGLVHTGRGVWFDLSRAYSSVSHKILLDKLMKYRLDKWMVRCFENWLNCWAQRVVVRSMKSRRSPGTNSVLQWLILGPIHYLPWWPGPQDRAHLQQVCRWYNTEGELLMNHMLMLTFRGMAVTWRNREEIMSCTPTGSAPAQLLTGWEAALQRRLWWSERTMSLQHALVARRANSLSRAASGTASHCLQVESVTLCLSSALERSHRECWAQSWASWYKQNLDIVEQIQQRATKIIKVLEHVSYVERPREMVLFNLET